MKTRDEIIMDMCYTWRHDYGVDRVEHDGPGGLILFGLTDTQRKVLWNQMSQLFDNCVAPHIQFKKKTDTNDNWVEP